MEKELIKRGRLFKALPLQWALFFDEFYLITIPQIIFGVFMVTILENKEIVSFEELLVSQVVQQEALTRLLVEKGIFTKEDFLEMVRIVNREMKREKE